MTTAATHYEQRTATEATVFVAFELSDNWLRAYNPTTTSLFDMSVVTRYAAAVDTGQQQEATYVTSLSDR